MRSSSRPAARRGWAARTSSSPGSAGGRCSPTRSRRMLGGTGRRVHRRRDVGGATAGARGRSVAAGRRCGHVRRWRRATAGFGPVRVRRARADGAGRRTASGWSSSTTVRARGLDGAHHGGRRGGGRRTVRRSRSCPSSETLKRIDGDRIAATVDRSGLAAAQTPQGVRRGILRTALASDEARHGTWTDEAALLEACRIPVHVVPGDPANLKVTVPADLARAASLIAGADPARRTGIGHDAHPFGPGEPLRLGGVDIPGAPRLHGHSDGDVVLHALADALLGAAGLGDLGRMFPADASTPAGIDSRSLLADVVARLGGRRLARGRCRPDDRGRAATARRASRGDPGFDRRRPGARAGGRQHQGVDAATSTAPRGPDDRSRRSRSRPSRPRT